MDRTTMENHVWSYLSGVEKGKQKWWERESQEVKVWMRAASWKIGEKSVTWIHPGRLIRGAGPVPEVSGMRSRGQQGQAGAPLSGTSNTGRPCRSSLASELLVHLAWTSEEHRSVGWLLSPLTLWVAVPESWVVPGPHIDLRKQWL